MSWILPEVRPHAASKVRTVRPLDMRGSGGEITEPPKTAAEQAPDRAPEPVTTPSPARPAATEEHTDMAEKKLAERIVNAFRKHGNMTLEQLAKRAETSVATLYTMMGSIKKQHGIAKLSQGKGPATYGFASKDTPPQRESEPKKPKQAPTKRINGSGPYAAALDGLRAKRSELAVELGKVDRAIEAIGALTA